MLIRIYTSPATAALKGARHGWNPTEFDPCVLSEPARQTLAIALDDEAQLMDVNISTSGSEPAFKRRYDTPWDVAPADLAQALERAASDLAEFVAAQRKEEQESNTLFSRVCDLDPSTLVTPLGDSWDFAQPVIDGREINLNQWRGRPSPFAALLQARNRELNELFDGRLHAVADWPTSERLRVTVDHAGHTFSRYFGPPPAVEERREAARREEIDAWIREHGSEYLRELRAEGFGADDLLKEELFEFSPFAGRWLDYYSSEFATHTVLALPSHDALKALAQLRIEFPQLEEIEISAARGECKGRYWVARARVVVLGFGFEIVSELDYIPPED